MPEDWSKQEVEIVVEDYLAMLALELNGQPYNKAERNRELQKLIPARSRGSIEFKHQNISAVLIEMGYPYVDGYKPRSNFQGLLAEIVALRLFAKTELTARLANLVQLPEEKVPRIDDILTILVEPPVRPQRQEAAYEGPPKPRILTRRNYLEQEARNQSLGLAGEELVMKFEQQRLWKAGAKKLSERIEHISKSEGDGCGFDILSFETDGRERLVEVKTTRFGALTPFFASKNEVQVSDERSAEYHVYRLFDFSKNPRLFQLNGSMRSTCTLEAALYRAAPATTDD